MKKSMPSIWNEIDTLFIPFLSFERVLLAVSGGSDSLALLYLTAEWAQRNQYTSPRFEVATVDHGLRLGSHQEAYQVKRHAESCGFAHHLLEWQGSKPKHALQERARQERYALMERVVRTWKEDRVAIATAHTCEDQAETLLMRLARGSGPDGLRGISFKRPLHASSHIFLLRPLLSVSRAHLRSWLSDRGIVWSEDPSNADERFERVKLRKAERTLLSLGLHPDKLALAAQRQQRAVAALEEATTSLQTKCLRLHEGAYGSLQRDTFERAPKELRVRLLQRGLNIFRGESSPADLEQVERLVVDLEKHRTLRQTLGGCEIHAKKDALLFYREVGRACLAPKPLLPDVPLVWDQRFRIFLSSFASTQHSNLNLSNFMVRPLDPILFRKLRESGEEGPRIPARAAATLPAVWWGEHLIMIGGLRWEKFGAQPPFSLTGLPIHADFLYTL